MNLDKLFSKKLSIAIVTLIMLRQAEASPWCIAAVGIAAIAAQMVLDYKGAKNEDSNNPDVPTD